MKVTKGESSEWINKKGVINGTFSWQEGYGAFSYSKSQGPQVISYVQEQEKHHTEKFFAGTQIIFGSI